MSQGRVERRLAAIVAIDVAGYSRLMGVDDEGTLAALRTIRRDLSDPKIKEHRGRIVKTTGDGLLVEFASVVDALRCAVEVQQAMAERNIDKPADTRFDLRVGINLGDIIIEDGDIFGDGVNVAARLEALAEPGGICVSRVVRDQVRDKLDFTFEDLGEQSVKNIARPVRVYTLSAVAVAALPKAAVPATPVGPATPQSAGPLHVRRYVAAVVLAGVLIFGGGLWWQWSSLKVPSTTVTAPAALEKGAPVIPAATARLSIVVLPFANLSADPEQQYFADGVTEDLTTDLSRIEDSFVISSNTAFTYKDKPVNAKQVGRELGVRYVLEGSVQRSGKQVRVNAQLIDAETDAHIWAERFERDIDDLFALQNEVTGRIANALDLALVGAEAARPNANPDALDFILRGRAALDKPLSLDNLAEAIGFFEHALTLDPHSVEAEGLLADALANRVFYLDQPTDTLPADIVRAEGLVGQALAASPLSPFTHFVKGLVLRAQRRNVEAIPEFEMMLASNRNFVGAIASLGWCKFVTGSIEDMIPAQEQAIRLSPRDPYIFIWYYHIGEAYLLQSHTDEAIVWLEKSRSANPAIPYVHALLASAYALKGETELATTELAEARRLARDDRYSSLARLQAVSYFGVPKVRALYEATYFVGLRKAGMPED